MVAAGSPLGNGGAATGDYPAGPYGWTVGMVAPEVSVQGYVAGQPPWATLDTKSYYDPTGSRGIHGLYLTVSAPWCAGCKLEGQAVPTLWNKQYKARGARILTVLLQGAAYEPASQGTADAWIATYGTPYDLGVGHVSDVLPPQGTVAGVGLPHNYAVDPRTMRIVAIDQNDFFQGDALSSLDKVLAKNGH